MLSMRINGANAAAVLSLSLWDAQHRSDRSREPDSGAPSGAGCVVVPPGSRVGFACRRALRWAMLQDSLLRQIGQLARFLAARSAFTSEGRFDEADALVPPEDH